MTAPLIRAGVALALVIAVGMIFNADGAFFKIATHRDALRQASVFGILACGMTVVVISGGIDLAVGSILALVAVSFSILSIWHQWPAGAAVLASLALGAACGMISGGLIARLRLQPFIATLAMMVFARGLAKKFSGGTKVSTAIPQPGGSFEYAQVPEVFRWIDSRTLGGNLSVVTIIFAITLLVSWIVLERHRWGRELYAIGGNEEAARLSGVRVALSKTLAYAFSGFTAAVAALCQAAQEQQGDPEAGAGYELTAIAIVVVGGTTLTGARGGIGFTLIGTITIGYLDKILSINAVPEASRLMLTGIIIVAAVLVQRTGRT
jgi:ribose transport system permease protein